MHRSTTFAATERVLLGLALLIQLVVAVTLLTPTDSVSATPSEPTPVPVTSTQLSVGSRTVGLRDGRTVQLVDMGASPQLLTRIAAELDGAADAVTAFWGRNWPDRITVVAAGSDEQFRVLAGGAPDIAATTTADRVMFAPGAAAMSPSALRIVVRHELFHFAARAATASDAPRWLAEGVADYVGRPAPTAPVDGALLTRLPTDADLDTTGPVRSLAYDRAWWFSRYVADRYGVGSLRALYLAACGNGHLDVDAAVRQTLRSDLATVLAGWRGWATG
jgi:hypothetical protein